MNWTEFHFFKTPGGLSKNDPLEMLVCLDYEQALECSRLVDLIKALRQDQRERMLEGVRRYPSRFVPAEAGPPPTLDGLPIPPFQDFETAVSFPPIPAACVAANWFPKHWLEVSSAKRRNVLDQVRSLYPISRFPMFPFPMDAEETDLLLKSLAARETLHVIAIDGTLPKSALIGKFKDWVSRQNDIDGSNSRKGRINVPARLDDLACYRLCRIEYAARCCTMDKVGFTRSEAKMSQAKARAAKRLRELSYI